MALLADEVEAGRRLMTAQARLVLGEIDDAVAAVADLRAGRGDVQRKELPAVGFWELLTRMLHHGFERNQLEDGADGILDVRDAIPEDAQRLRQLLGSACLMRVFRTWGQSRMHPKVCSDTETSAGDATDTIKKANPTTSRLRLNIGLPFSGRWPPWFGVDVIARPQPRPLLRRADRLGRDRSSPPRCAP